MEKRRRCTIAEITVHAKILFSQCQQVPRTLLNKMANLTKSRTSSGKASIVWNIYPQEILNIPVGVKNNLLAPVMVRNSSGSPSKRDGEPDMVLGFNSDYLPN